MNEHLYRRKILILQLAFSGLALLSLGLTVWAILAMAGRWSFLLPAPVLADVLGPDLAPSWQAFLDAVPGRVLAIALPASAPADVWAIALPLATTIVSVLAFLSTSVLAWRKERRQSTIDSLEIEHLRLEIEELKRKLEKSGQQRPSPPASE